MTECRMNVTKNAAKKRRLLLMWERLGFYSRIFTVTARSGLQS